MPPQPVGWVADSPHNLFKLTHRRISLFGQIWIAVLTFWVNMNTNISKKSQQRHKWLLQSPLYCRFTVKKFIQKDQITCHCWKKSHFWPLLSIPWTICNIYCAANWDKDNKYIQYTCPSNTATEFWYRPKKLAKTQCVKEKAGVNLDKALFHRWPFHREEYQMTTRPTLYWSVSDMQPLVLSIWLEILCLQKIGIVFTHTIQKSQANCR